MSGFPGDQGNYNQQHINFNNGNTHGQYSSQQYSWSSSQRGTPAQTSVQLAPQPQPQLQSPILPQMLPAPEFGQLQHGHDTLHLAGIQSGLQAQQNMLSVMQTSMNTAVQFQQPLLMQQQAQPQIQYVQPQQQLQYHQPSAPALLPAPAQQLQIAEAPYAAPNNADDGWRQEMIRGANKVGAGLQRLEQSQAHSRTQQEAKDREIAAVRLREQALQQQLLEAEQRHGRALADMALSQTSAPQPAFDMSALQKVIGEIQSDRISRDDIKQLVEDAVRNQLAGVAKTSDIDSAASRMERGLTRIPTGASTVDVQQTVQQELAKAVQKVARHMPTQQPALEAPAEQRGMPWKPQATPFESQSSNDGLPNPSNDMRSRISSASRKQKSLMSPSVVQQRDFPPNVAKHMAPRQLSLEAPISQQSVPWQERNSHFEAQYPIGELPGQGWEIGSQVSSSHKKQKSLPAPSEVQRANLPQVAPSRLRSDASSRSESSEHGRSKSRFSVAPSVDNALTRIKHDDRAGRRSKMSTVSAQPTAHNSVARSGANVVQRHTSSEQAMALAQARGEQLSEYGGHQAFAGLSDDFPDTASQVTAWERSQTDRRPPSDAGTVARVRARNDRRGDIGLSSRRQIEAIPEEDEDDMALVRQSKDVSKCRR